MNYNDALAEIKAIKERLDVLHEKLGTHHSNLGVRNAIKELCDAESWLELSIGDNTKTTPVGSGPLVSRVESAMKEASSLAAAIGKEHGSHPAMYAVNRAWHSLGIARDELEKTLKANK